MPWGGGPVAASVVVVDVRVPTAVWPAGVAVSVLGDRLALVVNDVDDWGGAAATVEATVDGVVARSVVDWGMRLLLAPLVTSFSVDSIAGAGEERNVVGDGAAASVVDTVAVVIVPVAVNSRGHSEFADGSISLTHAISASTRELARGEAGSHFSMVWLLQSTELLESIVADSFARVTSLHTPRA